jgi:hypothetical protein
VIEPLRRRAARPGSSLVELLAALPMLAIATGIALLLLVQSAADRRRTAYDQRGLRELRHARHLLDAELSPLSGGDLMAWRDSLLHFRAHLGVLRVCGANGTTLDVGAAPGDSTPAWVNAMRAGDQVTFWREPVRPADASAPDSASLTSAPSGQGTSACAGTGTARRWRLSLTANVDGAWVGAPVIVQRDVQYVHYRSSGQWWIGRRSRDAAGWDVVQPVFGPVESPARGGMRIRMLSVRGTPTSVAESVAVVRVALRLPPPAIAGRPSLRVARATDSAQVDVALRGEAWSRGRP